MSEQEPADPIDMCIKLTSPLGAQQAPGSSLPKSNYAAVGICQGSFLEPASLHAGVSIS